jgi:hypothetical protein
MQDVTTTPHDLELVPTRCELAHRLFTTFDDPLFRVAESDGTPVMVVQLGDKEAALPLKSLQREFGILDSSADGRMLALIAQSLEFVAGLRLGDPLPKEVLTGEASWEPDRVHLQIATTRLKLQLVDWLNAGSGAEKPDLDAESLLQVADDPHLREQVQSAMARAASALGVDSPAEVVSLLENLGQELAYIEALRDRLLRRLRNMIAKLDRLPRGWHRDMMRTERMIQVRRLSGTALRRISARFDELDAQTGEVMSALRNIEGQRAFIRHSRDWLYRSQRAWEPVLAEWDAAGTEINEKTLALLTRTYQFLAPRFMAATEWFSATRPRRSVDPDHLPGMVW